MLYGIMVRTDRSSYSTGTRNVINVNGLCSI